MGHSSEENSDIGVWKWGRPLKTEIIIESFLEEDRWSQERSTMGRQRGPAWGCVFLAGCQMGKGGKPGLEGLGMLAWRVWTWHSLLALCYHSLTEGWAGPGTRWPWCPGLPPGESLRVLSQMWCFPLAGMPAVPSVCLPKVGPFMPSATKSMVVGFFWLQVMEIQLTLRTASPREGQEWSWVSGKKKKK